MADLIFNNDTLDSLLTALCSSVYFSHYSPSYFSRIKVNTSIFDNAIVTLTDENKIYMKNAIIERNMINKCKDILSVVVTNAQEHAIMSLDTIQPDPIDPTKNTIFKYFPLYQNSLSVNHIIDNEVLLMEELVSYIKNYYDVSYNGFSLYSFLNECNTLYTGKTYNRKIFVNYIIDTFIKRVYADYPNSDKYNLTSINDLDSTLLSDLVKLTMVYTNNITSITNFMHIVLSLFNNYTTFINSPDFYLDYQADSTLKGKHTDIMILCIMTLILSIANIAEYDTYIHLYNKARLP